MPIPCQIKIAEAPTGYIYAGHFKPRDKCFSAPPYHHLFTDAPDSIQQLNRLGSSPLVQSFSGADFFRRKISFQHWQQQFEKGSRGAPQRAGTSGAPFRSQSSSGKQCQAATHANHPKMIAKTIAAAKPIRINVVPASKIFICSVLFLATAFNK